MQQISRNGAKFEEQKEKEVGDDDQTHHIIALTKPNQTKPNQTKSPTRCSCSITTTRASTEQTPPAPLLLLELAPNKHHGSGKQRNMCQLLGMNCATPTDFNFSFR
jgi:hypothetical protein